MSSPGSRKHRLPSPQQTCTTHPLRGGASECRISPADVSGISVTLKLRPCGSVSCVVWSRTWMVGYFGGGG